MSLLEVLISIFVILFGLLGVAAVLPLGSRNVADVVKSDNSSACGTSALRSVRAWGILNPYSWRWASFASSPSPVTTVVTTLNTIDYVPFGQSFAIDPLFLARTARVVAAPGNNTTDPRPQYFPYDPQSPSRTYWQLYMARVTLTLRADPPSGAMTVNDWARHEAFCSRFFSWQDDLTMPVLTGLTETERPRQMFFCSDSANHVRPNLATDSTTAVPTMAQTQGDYSWMAIVTPSLNETGTATWDGGGNVTADSSLPAKQRTQYLVQIVVFHKRDFNVPANYLTTDETPAERTVVANVLSGGYGGGDVKLTVPKTASRDFSGYLNVRKGNWIMLCGQTPRGNVYRWYRVVSPGEPPTEELRDNSIPDSVTSATSNWVRYVTLAGPDWNPAWCHPGTGAALDDVDGDKTLMDAAAVIADGVIGVYTMAFEIDRDLQVTTLKQ